MNAFPLIRSPKAALFGTLAVVLPLLLTALSPLTGMYTVMLALFLLPLALCTVSMTGGLLPLGVSLLGALYAMFLLLGGDGILLTGVYVLPILLVFAGVIAFRVPYIKAGAALVLSHVASLTAVYLILQQWTGQALYSAAGDAVAAFLRENDLADQILYMFYQSGMITLPESMKETMLIPVEDMFILSPEAKADLILSAANMISSLLSALVPSLLVSQSILGGLGCLYIPLRQGFITASREAFKKEGDEGYITGEDGKKKLDFPDIGTPPLSMWYMPRGVGGKIFLALMAGLILQMMASPAAVIAGTLLYTAASTLFLVQGIALINFMQKSRGTKRIFRIIVPALLMMFSVLSMVGMFDQFTNIRRLRKPRDSKEEE